MPSCSLNDGNGATAGIVGLQLHRQLGADSGRSHNSSRTRHFDLKIHSSAPPQGGYLWCKSIARLADPPSGEIAVRRRRLTLLDLRLSQELCCRTALTTPHRKRG